MATLPPPIQNPAPSPLTPSSNSPSVKSEIPTTVEGDAVPAAAAPSPELSPPISYTITIPSCAGWFSWGEIHETERRILPEFFDGNSAARNPSVYKYYRDSIVRRFRGNPARKLTFTEARRGLVGDVGGIRRVFDSLEAWGLINYVPSAKPSPKEKAGEGVERKEYPRKLCSNCKSVCGLACFATDKADIILCARCFVRGNYRPGLSSTDFKRVDISEETKTEWTDKETLHLLEAVLQYGEDWKKVAEHVGTRSEKDCIARFIKLPFGEQFLGPPEDREAGNDLKDPDLSKRMRLTPLADASNPIMAQVAFLSALVGSEVAEAASQAAVAALHEVDQAGVSKAIEPEDVAANGEDDLQDAAEAKAQLEKELEDVEQSISDIVGVELSMFLQMKEIKEKIDHFEAVDLQLEKERLQLRYMKDLLFADQLMILQHKARIKSSKEGGIRATNNSVT